MNEFMRFAGWWLGQACREAFQTWILGAGIWVAVGWTVGRGHQGSIWTYLFIALVYRMEMRSLKKTIVERNPVE